MTPIGHTALAVIIARAIPGLPVVPLLIGAVLPDIDFLGALTGQLNDWHRGATHSLLFALVAASVATLWHGRWGANALAMFVGVLSHLVTDSILDDNPSNGIGVPFFWPVDPASYAPFSLLQPSCPGWGDWRSAVYCSWPSFAWEAPLWLGAGIIAWRRCRKTV